MATPNSARHRVRTRRRAAVALVAVGTTVLASALTVLAERAGFRALRGQAMTALAEIHLALRKTGDAAGYARHALAIHRETGHRLGEVRALAVLARTPRAGQAVP